MDKNINIIHEYLISTLWTGWFRLAVWIICVNVIFLLYIIRVANDAEFTFASLAILPVTVLAWYGGIWNGITMSCIAAAMWIFGDIAAEREFSRPWVPWINAITRLTIYSLVSFFVAEVRLLLNRERQYATRDALTGLQNRRVFFEAGALEVARSKRYAHPIAVIFMDLDDFKQLNDNKGHDVGDAALRAVSRALLVTLRSSDRVARLGGDEFAALLTDLGHDEAVETGRQLTIAVNEALKDFPPVKASIGVAWFEKADCLFPAMLKVADELMYEVKEKAKGGRRMFMRRNG